MQSEARWTVRRGIRERNRVRSNANASLHSQSKGKKTRGTEAGILSSPCWLVGDVDGKRERRTKAGTAAMRSIENRDREEGKKEG